MSDTTNDVTSGNLTGVTEREHNGIRIVRIHYTADAKKRSDEWKEQAKLGLSQRDWNREYEIDWTSSYGLGVFSGDFSYEQHVIKASNIVIPSSAIIYRAWDFGLTPACVWWFVTTDGRAIVIDELATWDGKSEITTTSIDKFAEDVIRISTTKYGKFTFADHADPAGWQRSQVDKRSCIDVLAGFGIYPAPGVVSFESRRVTVARLLTTIRNGAPMLQFMPNCTMIIEGFNGAYQFAEIGRTGMFKNIPEKNAWSHPVDALTYGLSGIFSMGTDKRRYSHDEVKSKGRPMGDKITGY